MFGGETKCGALKRKLAARSATVGSWLSFPSTEKAEIMARAGFEWLVIDREHSAMSDQDMFRMIQVIDLCGVAPLVRVGSHDPLGVKRALECGAEGVIVPMISNPQEARAAVSAFRYPPHGTRGVGMFRAQAYGQDLDGYWKRIEESGVLIAQIEHRSAVEQIDEIMAVEGIDGFMIGPYDLSGSYGAPGDFEHPQVVAALERLHEAAARAGKPLGIHVVNPSADDLKARMAQGFAFAAFGTDMHLFGAAAAAAGGAAKALSSAN